MSDADFTPGQEAVVKEWWGWVNTRPEKIQEMCRTWPAFYKYHLKTTGQMVWIHSYSENNTVTVNIYSDDNPDFLLVVNRQVFGVDPHDLERVS